VLFKYPGKYVIVFKNVNDCYEILAVYSENETRHTTIVSDKHIQALLQVTSMCEERLRYDYRPSCRDA